MLPTTYARVTCRQFEIGRQITQGGGVPLSIGQESLVLTLTENATTVVQAITEQNSQADGAGLRISHEGSDQNALAVAPAEAPEPGDTVVENGPARIFLEQEAATSLDDKVLDASVDQAGAVQFSIGIQETPQV
jgi:Fe-S cluster assembly iron-binding protein IscA